MSRLFLTDIVESVEDVAAVLEGVFLGTLQPLGIDHRQHLVAVVVLPLPCVSDDATPGDAADFLAKAEHRVDGRLEAAPSVPAEDELVAVDVDVLLPKAVVGAHGPALEVREDAMHPLQDNMSRQRILGA